MDLHRHGAERRRTLRTVRRARAGRGGDDGLFQRGLHFVGRHLHDDGHSLLVDDPCRDPHPRRPRKPVRCGAHLRRCRLGADCHVHHAAGRHSGRRQRARGFPLGGAACGGSFCCGGNHLLRQCPRNRRRQDADRHSGRDVQGAVLQRSGTGRGGQHCADQLGAVPHVQLYHLLF